MYTLRKLQELPNVFLSNVDEAEGWEMEEASFRRRIQSMLDEICESVPYHLGWSPADASRLVQEESPPACWMWDALLKPSFPIASTREAHLATAAFYLQQPLYNAACVPEAPTAQRTWMQKRLHDIINVQGDISSCLLVRIAGAEMLQYAQIYS